MTLCGGVNSTERSADARSNSASRLISTPGEMTHSRYSQAPLMTSNVVPVPKSTTIVGPP